MNDNQREQKSLTEQFDLIVEALNKFADEQFNQTHEISVYDRVPNEEIGRMRYRLAALESENARLKGKVVSPEVTTMSYCEDCGAATRWGRHLDIDCKEVQRLKQELAQAAKDHEAIRISVANYVQSEGCGCCQGHNHSEHKKVLAELLKVPMYSDGSGYDFNAILAAKEQDGK